MTRDSVVFKTCVFGFLAYLIFMAGYNSNDAKCPSAINEIPGAKFKEAVDYQRGPLVCIYSVDVVRGKKGKSS